MNLRQNLKKRPFLLRSEIGIFDIFFKRLYEEGFEIGIFDIFFKRLYEEGFEDLQINSNWKFQTRFAMFQKMATL